MACTGCAIELTTKLRCTDCGRFYCTQCITADAPKCKTCVKITKHPLTRANIQQLGSDDIRSYLDHRGVPTRSLSRREPLVSVLLATLARQTGDSDPERSATPSSTDATNGSSAGEIAGSRGISRASSVDSFRSITSVSSSGSEPEPIAVMYAPLGRALPPRTAMEVMDLVGDRIVPFVMRHIPENRDIDLELDIALELIQEDRD